MAGRLILPDERNDDTAVQAWEVCAAFFCAGLLILILVVTALADEERARVLELEAGPRGEVTDTAQRVPTDGGAR